MDEYFVCIPKHKYIVVEEKKIIKIVFNFDFVSLITLAK